MDKRQKKALEEAYDKAYNLSSIYGFNFIEDYMTELKDLVKSLKYEFYLKQSSQKFKLRRVEE